MIFDGAEVEFVISSATLSALCGRILVNKELCTES